MEQPIDTMWFICAYCGRAYSQPEKLKGHLFDCHYSNEEQRKTATPKSCFIMPGFHNCFSKSMAQPPRPGSEESEPESESPVELDLESERESYSECANESDSRSPPILEKMQEESPTWGENKGIDFDLESIDLAGEVEVEGQEEEVKELENKEEEIENVAEDEQEKVENEEDDQNDHENVNKLIEEVLEGPTGLRDLKIPPIIEESQPSKDEDKVEEEEEPLPKLRMQRERSRRIMDQDKKVKVKAKGQNQGQKGRRAKAKPIPTPVETPAADTTTLQPPEELLPSPVLTPQSVTHKKKGQKSADREKVKGDKSYQCSICLKDFARYSYLFLHSRLHTGERPYSCRHQGCDKSFSYPANRIAHERLHTGERPYACTECPKTFANASNFKKHKQTNHELETSPKIQPKKKSRSKVKVQVKVKVDSNETVKESPLKRKSKPKNNKSKSMPKLKVKNGFMQDL